MTTRAELRSILQTRLSDAAAATWSTTTLNTWIGDAIRDYSSHFPRHLSADLAASTGTHEYSLASLVNPQALLRVEYPTGDDPPTYLIRSDEGDTARFYGGDYYDMQGTPPQTLIIGPDATTGQSIRVDYLADHAQPTADGDVLTIPDHHLEALILYCRWAAVQERAALEEQSPDSTTIMVTMLSQAAQRAALIYHAKLRELKANRYASSAIVRWFE